MSAAAAASSSSAASASSSTSSATSLSTERPVAMIAQAVQLLASAPHQEAEASAAAAAAPASGSDGSEQSSSTSFNSPAALASGSSSTSHGGAEAPRSIHGSDDEAPPQASAMRSNVLSSDDFPQSGLLHCRKWVGATHPVRPCDVFSPPSFPSASATTPAATTAASTAARHSNTSVAVVAGDYYRFAFRDHRVATVEKFIDDTFEYSFAYEYRPNGSIMTVTTTRASLGVLVEHFDDVPQIVTAKDRSAH